MRKCINNSEERKKYAVRRMEEEEVTESARRLPAADERPSSQESFQDVQDDSEEESTLAIDLQRNQGENGRYMSTGRYDLLKTRNIRLAVTTLGRRPIPANNRHCDEGLVPADLTPCNNYKTKMKEVLQFVSKTPNVADLKLSYYIVACEKQNFVKPFPNHLVEETEEGHNRLTLLNEEIPCVTLLVLYLSQNVPFQVNEGVISLLHWLFISLQDPKLKSVPPESFPTIFNKVESAMNYEQPSELFRAMYSRSNPVELKWQALKANRKSKFAFYSDSLNTMHSLIHLGFHTYIKSEGVYGPGIYLFADLRKCMEYSGSGWGWGKSSIGMQFKTILVVEFLDDPDVKMYNGDRDSLSSRDQKALTNGTQGDCEEVLCYFVPRAELLRVRYVGVFVKCKAQGMPIMLPVEPKGQLRQWLQRHKRMVCLVGTIFLSYATTHYLQVALGACAYYINKIQRKAILK